MRLQRMSQAERGAEYIEKETSSPGYKKAAAVIVPVLALFYHYIETPHPGPRLHVTHASATYDALGKVSEVNITCADDAKQDAACDSIVLNSERAYFQMIHDKEAADAAKAAAQRNHDPKTHR